MDDLTRIKGIGPAAAKKLAAAGIDTFAGLGGVSTEDAIVNGIKPDWIAQAAALMHEGSNEIPAGSPVEEIRQPAPVGVIASASAGAPSGEGPGEVDTHEKVASEAGAVAIAPEPSSAADAEAAAVAAALDFGAGLLPDEADIDESLGVLLEGYPRLLAAVRAYRAANPERSATGVRISARRDGFRRCGVAHPKAPVDHPSGRFSADELERLFAEPTLTVELV